MDAEYLLFPTAEGKEASDWLAVSKTAERIGEEPGYCPV